jgi:hypothetical protein
MAVAPQAIGQTQLVYFFNSDKVGASPAQAKQTISWIGQLKKATLTVKFDGKFGWELQKATFNGAQFESSKYRIDQKNPNHIVADVTSAIINGDNVLTVHYAHPFTAYFGDLVTLTAYVQLLVVGLGSTLPSLNLLAENLQQKAAAATVPTIAILAIVAAIAVSGAVIVAKVIR